MIRRILSFASLFLLVATFHSCAKTDAVESQGLDQSVLNRIEALGFHSEDVVVTEGGYIVEGDIFLTEDDLNAVFGIQSLIVGSAEQYRTTNLVTALPRNIDVWIKTSGSNALPTSYGAALDEAINRYNAQSLLVSFTRVTSQSAADIKITKAPSGSGYLASAGFPSGGNPYNSVKVNSDYLGSNPGTNYLGTILAHEIGHCIGFRHTDYMDRSYSCGGGYANEGQAGVGAIHIPGTPTTADANSWMLACIGTGQNRPFNGNDITALKYLY